MSNNDFLEKYEISNEIIGNGSFGVIKKAKTIDGKNVAIKIVDKKKITPLLLSSVLDECQILSKLDHKNILKVIEWNEDENNYYCVMDYIKDGDLYSLLKEREFSKDEAFHILDQLLDAVEYLHNNNIIHRDIKPENILVSNSDSMDIVLSDFGFATFQELNSKLLKDWPGTTLYASPELISARPYRGRKSDIWAIGVTFYVILTGEFPFYSEDRRETIRQILKDDIEFNVKGLTKESFVLLTLMLNKNPSKRISIKQIRETKSFSIMKNNYKKNHH